MQQMHACRVNCVWVFHHELFCGVQMEEMRKEVEGMQASSRDYSSKLATLTRQLEDRDAKLKRMGAERQKHLEEVYEMK